MRNKSNAYTEVYTILQNLEDDDIRFTRIISKKFRQNRNSCLKILTKYQHFDKILI